MKRTKQPMHLGTGASSILMIFVVLCLTTFGVLSYTSARADLKLTEKNLTAVQASYQADAQAQNKLSEIDGALAAAQRQAQQTGREYASLYPSALAGIQGVIVSGETISFSVPIDDRQQLQVELRALAPGSKQRYELTSYRTETTAQWQEDEDDGQVWQGNSQ